MPRLLPSSTDRRADRILAVAGLILPGGAALAVGLGVPITARFIILVIATLYGPATPAFRLACQMPWFECLALGIGIDAALVMATGQGMVMLGRWAPGEAVACLLLSSILVAVALFHRSVNGLGDECS